MCVCLDVYTCMHMVVLLKRNGAKKRWELGNLSLGSIGLLSAVLVKAEWFIQSPTTSKYHSQYNKCRCVASETKT